MIHPALVPHADLLVTVGDPKSSRMLDRPRRVRVRWRTYGGDEVTLELEQAAAARDVVCVRQDRGMPDPWNAWVPAALVEPI
ncbi:hypothetical protein OEB99_17865 [Actinotalea sp. M2MS4P-6]|uniref:hypothetical protein n=1 Tax=Actinotalea sp. M2MS4P-6 TaxID=2983762 RepID=UPI0021E4A663|nr:hypothetical protein [Actinotalea sp. M2MS4P-6]MCV2396181.1 hypothetical protein [Actinotalea sp. M2MS4P-6]